MPRKYQTSIGSFTRKSSFFWAALGATVGLANLWQFPYLASQHGGGLFILLYLACLLLVTLPLMVTETVFGRHARHGIVLAMAGYVKTAGSHPLWRLAGPLSIVAAFLVLSFTVVFGGIVLAYIFYGATGQFGGSGEHSAGRVLTNLVADPGNYREFMAWHVFFLLLVVLVSVRGVVSGVERSVRILVPFTLMLMVGLFLLSVAGGQVGAGVEQILESRPEQLGFGSIRAAFFHAFYTLGLGMGVWAIFGAYAAPGTRLKRSILAVVLMDTLFAIGAGLMMFSVAGGGLDSERGFGLLFVSLPDTLSVLPYSQAIIAAVFLLVVLIVWATSIALLEPLVGWFREWVGAPRRFSVGVMAIGVWLAGLATLFSFNLWSEYHPAGASLFRWLELISGGILIPLVGILISAFTGWCLTRKYANLLLGHATAPLRKYWYWVLRFVVPLVVAWIGLQYTVFSLANVCETSHSAIWCGRDQSVIEDQPVQDEPRGGDIQYDNE
ncbi:sodium-dependent transporter [Marinobacter persicus]|uniref:NSS family neurotransmitter:Na+ symporter n=1 Tax=Marinobacter persicus TaxID=930118 RepID=A0A2S6GAM1_9GAMM|nr:sodium-dependent transporter [Marinobacter persicus]PPK53615.1 NSS family neurotransmitter:Na+ symporter [Marinobacter persicus]PPK56429.1 NSS family neurotransmitter:Na+ symporter [Marinobacter persicus]PPK60002.1 NSS family neurotransmitter:Na+ symporter [Marinobacter persicus]